MVIHKDLYDVIKELTFFKEYRFEEVNNYKNKFVNKQKSVYSVYFTNKEIIKENSSIVSSIKGDSHYKEYPQQIINNSNNNNQIQKKDNNSQNHDKLDNSLFKILLIDDNEDILFLFTSILDGEGYRTTSISNPVKALNYFSQIETSILLRFNSDGCSYAMHKWNSTLL